MYEDDFVDTFYQSFQHYCKFVEFLRYEDQVTTAINMLRFVSFYDINNFVNSFYEYFSTYFSASLVNGWLIYLSIYLGLAILFS